jgi:tRNA 2-thiouridine synthesizing protein E
MTTNLDDIAARLDALSAQMNYLVERERRKEEMIEEFTPILREVMATATTRLQALDQQGWFSFGRALWGVIERVVEGYSAQDVEQLGGAIVSILDTVRALTQPQVLTILAQSSEVLQHANAAEPIGLVGMVRASRNEDVQKGMAVLMDLLRHVGQAARVMAEQPAQAQASTPADDRKARLAQTLGPRRSKKALGVERTPAPRAAPRPGKAGPPPIPADACATSRKPAPAAVVMDGVAFTAEGHLVDPSQWTRDLAENIAAAQGMSTGLTPEQWAVIEFARADFGTSGVSPNIRRLTQGTGLSTKDLYTLFPKAPARTIARIAGLPKPAGCI